METIVHIYYSTAILSLWPVTDRAYSLNINLKCNSEIEKSTGQYQITSSN